MSLLFWQDDSKKSANRAKERLTLVLAHERSANIPYLEDMQKEILQVVQKYTKSKEGDIHFTANSNQHISTLQVQITLSK